MPGELLADWSTIDARLARATNLVQLAIDEPRRRRAVAGRSRSAARSLPARHRAEGPRRPTGLPRSGVSATRDTRSCSSPRRLGRAERTIELLKEYDVFAIPVDRAEDARYAAVLVAVGGLSRGFRLPDAGLQIYAEADVFEEERRAPERRQSAARRFCRTCGISSPATWSSTSTTGSESSSA